MAVFPILISVPHGGDQAPPELWSLNQLSSFDILADNDPFTRDLYQFSDRAMKWIDTEIARAYVDLNRAPDQRAPSFPDGVVKEKTVFKKQIYSRQLWPDAELTETLLNRYYYPFHQRLESGLRQQGIKLAVDCHSMLSKAPPISERHGELRPLVCLGNLGDEHGEPVDDQPTTCPGNVLRALAAALRQELKINETDVKLNSPFKGGYLTRRHGFGEVPWVQLEIRRSLYLEDETVKPVQNTKKLVQRREQIWTALETVLEQI